ncbi:hypothetical protein AJ79_07469 [Helicocarpus griseus UAMH5409]|uniref:Uncharacterized protein n=1 Tax=Helicocarpus griseus UAMH5409 TaxID=1447875 RepID=A0A2B7X2Q2_9EURO|nr:hypothetical protein AJ79_07469 [Helicocarpus griseus UAMH5409]
MIAEETDFLERDWRQRIINVSQRSYPSPNGGGASRVIFDTETRQRAPWPFQSTKYGRVQFGVSKINWQLYELVLKCSESFGISVDDALRSMSSK